MLHALAQAATQPAEDPWGQLRSAVVAGLLLIIAAAVAFVVKWINTLSNKLAAADAKSDINSQRITNTNARLDTTNATLTTVALNTPSPTPTVKGGPLPGGIVGSNLDGTKQ